MIEISGDKYSDLSMFYFRSLPSNKTFPIFITSTGETTIVLDGNDLSSALKITCNIKLTEFLSLLLPFVLRLVS